MSLSVLSLALNTLNAVDSLEQATVYHVCKVARHDGIVSLPGINTLATREIDNVLCLFIKIAGLNTLLGCLQTIQTQEEITEISQNNK